MSAETPQWDHGRYMLEGQSEFAVTVDGNISRLHLVSFPSEVQEEEIDELEKQRGLRGVTQAEWKAFVETYSEALRTAQFSIALMHTGQMTSYDRFPQTIIFNPGGSGPDYIQNWTQAVWSPDTAFMFAERTEPIKEISPFEELIREIRFSR